MAEAIAASGSRVDSAETSLLVDELMSNALRHGGGTMEVVVRPEKLWTQGLHRHLHSGHPHRPHECGENDGRCPLQARGSALTRPPVDKAVAERHDELGVTAEQRVADQGSLLESGSHRLIPDYPFELEGRRPCRVAAVAINVLNDGCTARPHRRQGSRPSSS